MNTVAPTTVETAMTQEDMLVLGLAAYRDAVDSFRDLTGTQRRAVLIAAADLLSDLRVAQVIR